MPTPLTERVTPSFHLDTTLRNLDAFDSIEKPLSWCVEAPQEIASQLNMPLVASRVAITEADIAQEGKLVLRGIRSQDYLDLCSSQKAMPARDVAVLGNGSKN